MLPVLFLSSGLVNVNFGKLQGTGRAAGRLCLFIFILVRDR